MLDPGNLSRRSDVGDVAPPTRIPVLNLFETKAPGGYHKSPVIVTTASDPQNLSRRSD